MSVAIPPGTYDVVPQPASELWKQSSLWQLVESACRDQAKLFACQEIRTPIFERTDLFARSVGEETDIVNKEMYTFEDRGGRSLTLRPEGTAAVMRAFISNKLQNLGAYHRLFYLGPMFRYERPQAGRYRQHQQFGVEVIGGELEHQDVELVLLINSLFQALGVQDVEFIVNHLGSSAERIAYREALIEYLNAHHENLSEDSQRRLKANPLRILDSKDKGDQQILANAPKISQFLSDESSRSFEKIIELLDQQNIQYKVDNHLVRGLDYYTGFVYEVKAGLKTAQSSLGGGGRYDGLLKSLGGPDLPSCGFAIGIERLILTLLNQGNLVTPETVPDLFIIPLDDVALSEALKVSMYIRAQGVSCQMQMKPSKLKNALKKASQNGNNHVLIIGEEEVTTQKYILKDMKKNSQSNVSLEEIIEQLAKD